MVKKVREEMKNVKPVYPDRVKIWGTDTILEIIEEIKNVKPVYPEIWGTTDAILGIIDKHLQEAENGS